MARAALRSIPTSLRSESASVEKVGLQADLPHHNEGMSEGKHPHAAHGIDWDLKALYTGIQDPAIGETWDKVLAEADQCADRYRGRIVSGELSASELATAIQEAERWMQEASKPVIYANLVFSADAGNPKHGAFLQEQMERSSEAQVKVIFFELEMQKADPAYLEKMLQSPELATYRHYLEQVKKTAEHRLTEAEEQLLEEVANTGSRAWVRFHDEILSTYRFEYRAPGSDEVEMLSQEELLNMLRESDREVRQAAADAFSAGLTQLEKALTFTYNTLLADKRLEDKLRKHPYPEHSRHLSNELDKPTVDLVMRLCKERGDIVARYYHVKREILGLPELTHIDRYAPLFDSAKKVNWDDAKKMVLDAFGEFHPEIRDRADEFFGKRWIDAAPREGKTGGAFCSYNTVDTHPVIMMTYLGKLGDVMTLAHELGHGVHASLSREQTPFNYHGTLPLAELASIFGEILVFENLVKEVDEKEKLALYADKVEGIFASVFRQSAMFRFEQRCHEKRRAEGELSADEFGEIWQEELQAMFGDAVKMEDQHKRWWSYVGHFFFAPFYVYAYSFGELLTLALYNKAKAEGPGFAEKYIEVLRLGGSQTPQELMGHLGVDLTDESFWQGGFDAIEEMVKTFEALWASQKATA